MLGAGSGAGVIFYCYYGYAGYVGYVIGFLIIGVLVFIIVFLDFVLG